MQQAVDIILITSLISFLAHHYLQISTGVCTGLLQDSWGSSWDAQELVGFCGWQGLEGEHAQEVET